MRRCLLAPSMAAVPKFIVYKLRSNKRFVSNGWSMWRRPSEWDYGLWRVSWKSIIVAADKSFEAVIKKASNRIARRERELAPFHEMWNKQKGTK